MLYLVATPIGNLKDISMRAIEVLSSCDYILCEDTRHSQHLLNHYEIQPPTRSYHKFNEASAEEKILDDLKAGKTIALITDAGTPGISDPGTRLVQACHDQNLEVSSVPGPCACIAAVTLSGLPTDRFQFLGFLPKKASDLKNALVDALMYPGTSIFYESPNRLINTITLINTLAPNRILAIAKELTKKFESIDRGTAEELLKIFESSPPRGEYILMISGDESYAKEKWQALTPEEHVSFIETSFSLSKSEAIKLVAQLRGVPKRDIYQMFHS